MHYPDSSPRGKMPPADISPDCRSTIDYADCIHHALRTGTTVPHPRTDRERRVLLASYPAIAAGMGVDHV